MENYNYQCPVSGYYQFYFSMYSDRMHNMELSAAAIFLEGERIAGQRMFKQGEYMICLIQAIYLDE